MKVAIYSLTRDRLDYSKHCFEALSNLAGHPFDHYVVDNGSEDGTREWLREQEASGVFKTVIYNEHNLGIAPACNQALDAIGGSYDLIIKMDNDCEVITENLLKRVVSIYRTRPFEKLLVSPHVNGIIKQPIRQRTGRMNGQVIGFTAHVGGLFAVLPSMYYQQFRFNCKGLQLAKGDDTQLSGWVRRTGGRCGYLENTHVNHYETTVGQRAKYPEYFQRKYIEEETPYADR